MDKYPSLSNRLFDSSINLHERKAVAPNTCYTSFYVEEAQAVPVKEVEENVNTRTFN